MNTTINTVINGQRVEVEVRASEVMCLANQIETALHAATQNIMVFAADAYDWDNGKTIPSIGIRMANVLGGDPFGCVVGDINYLIAGTLRRIENDKELVRLRDLMKIGFENAYIDLRGQGMCGVFMHTPKLGKRRIIDMHIVGDRAYLKLAPME